MVEFNEKIFFTPGDKCICTQLKDAPEMYVIRKKEITIHAGDNKLKTLQGIVCRYLDKLGIFREELFNTKDIKKID